MNGYVLTLAALADLDAICDHFREINPSAGVRLLDAIEKQFERLVMFPLMGEHRPELGDEIRCFPVKRYVIFYRPLGTGIQVLRVLFGSRDIQRSMFDR